MELPLHIIEKYRDMAPEGKLLPMYSNSSLNHYLKQIAGLCGIERKLVFHQARHNFGTHITLSSGVPLETVSKMMGHCRFDTTQIYARRSQINRNLNLYEEDLSIGKRTKNLHS